MTGNCHVRFLGGVRCGKLASFSRCNSDPSKGQPPRWGFTQPVFQKEIAVEDLF